MSNNVTKILVRQGPNIVRKSTPGIILDSGEPGYTTDSHRMYIGDGSTTGGIPVGIKNWGTVSPLFSSAGSYHSSVLTTISSVEAGDIIYDSSIFTLYYATISSPTPAQWTAYALTNTISGYNGIAASTVNNTFSAGLGAGFTVVDTAGPSQGITFNYNVNVNTGKTLTLNTGNLVVAGGGILSATTGDSNKWGSVYTSVATTSANWNSTYSTVKAASANWSSTTVASAYWPRAWGFFDGVRYNTATKVLTSFFGQNINQIVRLRAGVYYIEFTVNMPSLNYMIVGSGLQRQDPDNGNVAVSEYWSGASTLYQTASGKSLSAITIQAVDTDVAPPRQLVDSAISFTIHGY